jgi:hypothetical protein
LIFHGYGNAIQEKQQPTISPKVRRLEEPTVVGPLLVVIDMDYQQPTARSSTSARQPFFTVPVAADEEKPGRSGRFPGDRPKI